MATRRLRSGEAGVYFLSNGQRGPLAIPTNATSACSNETATGRMDFGSAFYRDPIMGFSVAVTITGCCGCFGVAVVPLCRVRLRTNCGINCARGIRIESAHPASGYPGAHRYAARARHFCHWPVDLEKNPG